MPAAPGVPASAAAAGSRLGLAAAAAPDKDEDEDKNEDEDKDEDEDEGEGKGAGERSVPRSISISSVLRFSLRARLLLSRSNRRPSSSRGVSGADSRLRGLSRSWSRSPTAPLLGECAGESAGACEVPPVSDSDLAS